MGYNVLYMCLLTWVMSGLISGEGFGGAQLGEQCIEDSDCYDDHQICVGSPCSSTCGCEPGYKPCRLNWECIPDLSDTVLAGGNCTLDSECKGTGSYCKRDKGNFNNNGDPLGFCVAGQLTLKQTGNTGQGGGCATVHASQTIYLLNVLVVIVVTFVGSK